MIDLLKMSVTEMRDLEGKITSEIKKRQHEQMSGAREKILAIAQSVGIPLKDLMGNIAQTLKQKGTVAVRFRHKNDPTLKWTGRGRQPKWVKEWVDGGKSIDELRV